MFRKKFSSFCNSGQGGLNASRLVSKLGIEGMSLNGFAGTAVGVRGLGGYMNRFGDVKGAVIDDDSD